MDLSSKDVNDNFYPDFQVESVSRDHLEHAFCLYKMMIDNTIEQELHIQYTDYSQKDLASYYFVRINQDIVFYLEISPMSKTGFVSFCFATLKEYRKQGYAFHILSEISQVLFQKFSCKGIYWTIQPENSACLGLAHKLGFQKAGNSDFTYILNNPYLADKNDILAEKETSKISKIL